MRLTLLERAGDVAHLACSGEISHLYTTDRDPFVELLGPGCYGLTVVLDLQKTTFIESSGISWFVRCHTRFARGGGKLVLHSLPPIIEDFLVKLVRLDKLIPIHADSAAAREAVEKGGQP